MIERYKNAIISYIQEIIGIGNIKFIKIDIYFGILLCNIRYIQISFLGYPYTQKTNIMLRVTPVALCLCYGE